MRGAPASRTLRGLLPALLCAAQAASPPPLAAQAPVAHLPSPEAYLGFRPGEDRRLADWSEIGGWLGVVAEASDRVRLDTIGRSTLGAPLLLVTISDPANLARLEELRDVQGRLADPRRISGREEREELLRRGRLVVLITTGIHSTEVGSTLLPFPLVHRLVTSQSAEVAAILRETIVLLVPSLNPDGVDLVAGWYRRTLDMPWEGAEPPFLYHPYVGHDNNRDWYALTQRETRAVVRRVHAVWHPHIVHDVHQHGAKGSRFFVPPWLDPIEPNVDPLLIAGANALGTSIAWELLRQGKSGVAVHAEYDAWTPARAYSHYHAGVRILSETASALLASPLTLSPADLEEGRGFDPRRATWNHPRPWPGGRWGLADILEYMDSGAMALLRHAARNRESWLRGFLAVGERAVAGWEGWPAAWVIPAGQEGGEGVHELLRILLSGEVEVARAVEPFTADGRAFPAGSYVIAMRQPYAAYAQALLAPRRYPALREGPEGRIVLPYDVTAHALPLLLGVEAVAIRTPPPERGERLALRPRPEPRVEGLSGDPGVLVGLYRPYLPSIDEGWTRWILERHDVPYRSLDHRDVLRGGLGRDYTAIVLPSIGPRTLREGRPVGSVPDPYAGGLGQAGADELRAFVEGGGTLVALDSASAWAIEALRLPVRDALRGLTREEYFAPGAIVRLAVEIGHPLAAGVAAGTAAWLENGPAFEPLAPEVRVIARYGRAPTLLSGLLVGEERIAGRAAAVEVPLGRGRVVLFGFRPQYRGQSLATYPFLFNALRRPRPDGAEP